MCLRIWKLQSSWQYLAFWQWSIVCVFGLHSVPIILTQNKLLVLFFLNRKDKKQHPGIQIILGFGYGKGEEEKVFLNHINSDKWLSVKYPAPMHHCHHTSDQPNTLWCRFLESPDEFFSPPSPVATTKVPSLAHEMKPIYPCSFHPRMLMF